MKGKVNGILKKAGDVITSDKAVNFAKETIKETATDSIKTAGRYVVAIILSVVFGLAGLIFFTGYVYNKYYERKHPEQHNTPHQESGR